MRNYIAILFFTTATICYSQINTFYIKPIQTNIQYAAVQDSHLVVRNTTTNLNKLFLFIGGTGSNTKQYATISNFAGNLGYDVINLSYPNTVAVASLANSSDSLAFNKYRQEVCYGTTLSVDVSVDTLNSIYYRTLELINYLNTIYPTQNWSQYLINPTTLDWTKIAVGGHSQGGGHACYLGKYNNVERVLMFSSPNDYSNYFSNSANWLRTAGITPISKHFAYLSLLDEIIDFNKQLVNLQGLGLYPAYDTTYVDNSNSPYSNSHCLYTTQAPWPVFFYHNTTTKFSTINNSVWTYILSSTITGFEGDYEKNISRIYPNPANGVINIFFKESLIGKTYRILNINGQTILKNKITTSNPFSIDLSALTNGLYFISVGNQAITFIKQ